SSAARLRGVRARQISQKSADTLDRLVQVLEAVGVRNADVILAERAKAGAGDRRDSGAVQKLGLQCLAVEACAGDVGERVKGAARVGAAYPRQAVQRGDHHLAPFGESA